MTRKMMRQFLSLGILMAVFAGPAAAHETDAPHTHDPAGEAASAYFDALTPAISGAHAYPAVSAPMAFLVIPIGGESFPFHWLWHAMNGEVINDRIHLAHELAGWYQIPHFHQPDTRKVERDHSVSPYE